MANVLQLTLGELSELTELPERTLRLYRTKGLLEAPEVRGRVGYYGDTHVRQIRIIKAMTARGFPLGTIAHLTRLGVSRTALMLLLDGMEADDTAVPQTALDTILAPVAEREIGMADADLIPKLIEIGIIYRDQDGRIRTDALGLAVVSDLLRAGLSMPDIAAFVLGISAQAVEARVLIDEIQHPSLKDATLHDALIEAATVSFRHALRAGPRP